MPRISSRTSRVQRSSESRLKIQSWVQCSSVRLRRLPKPSNGTCTTRAPSDVAISAVRSVLPESATITSSAHRMLETASAIFSASL